MVNRIANMTFVRRETNVNANETTALTTNYEGELSQGNDHRVVATATFEATRNIWHDLGNSDACDASARLKLRP